MIGAKKERERERNATNTDLGSGRLRGISDYSNDIDDNDDDNDEDSNSDIRFSNVFPQRAARDDWKIHSGS